MTKKQKNIISIVLIVITLFIVYNLLSNQRSQSSIRFSDFLKMVENGQVVEASIQGEEAAFFSISGHSSSKLSYPLTILIFMGSFIVVERSLK